MFGTRDCENLKSYPNICATQGAKTADGSQVLGTTVFVWTDCGTNERLPADKQDPAYNHDGVALPQAELVSVLGLGDPPAQTQPPDQQSPPETNTDPNAAPADGSGGETADTTGADAPVEADSAPPADDPNATPENTDTTT